MISAFGQRHDEIRIPGRFDRPLKPHQDGVTGDRRSAILPPA